jgi:hypothetical protein
VYSLQHVDFTLQIDFHLVVQIKQLFHGDFRAEIVGDRNGAYEQKRRANRHRPTDKTKTARRQTQILQWISRAFSSETIDSSASNGAITEISTCQFVAKLQFVVVDFPADLFEKN